MVKNKTVGQYKVNGKWVVDANEPVTVTIKRGDISRASERDPGCCVMANAVKRQYKTEARVHRSRVFLLIPGETYKGAGVYRRFVVGAKLHKEIHAFDRGGKFYTGDYTLNPPLANRRLGYKKPTGPKKMPGQRRAAAKTITKGVRVGPAQWGA